MSWVELAHTMLKEWAFDPGNSECHVSLVSLMAHGCSSPGNAIVESGSMAIIMTCRENLGKPYLKTKPTERKAELGDA